MKKFKKRFVIKFESKGVWRIWDIMQKKYWGEIYQTPPDILLMELNRDKRPEVITELIKQSPRKKK